MKLNYLVNLKSGLCPEDCSYCSQRLGSKAEILKYTWLKPDEASQAAAAGVAGGAKRVCLVASGRGPDRPGRRPGLRDDRGDQGRRTRASRCAPAWACSPDGQAERLRAAGADAYNHNLNTSEATYGDICTTHTYADRVETVAAGAGGRALRLLRSDRRAWARATSDLVDVVFALRELDPDSVPVNFLIPFEGTPLAEQWNLTPQRCLRILAMVPLRLPGRGGPARGRARGAPALAAAARPAPGQLDLPRRLSDQRGPGGAGRPGHDRGRRLRGGGRRHRRRRRSGGPARTDPVAVRRRGAGTDLAPNA